MKSLLHLVEQLISPVVPVADVEEYQQTRILASISLAVLIVALLAILLMSPSYSEAQIQYIIPVVIGFMLFLIPYYLSRHGHLKVAALALALIAVFQVEYAAISLGGDIGQDTLHYLVLIVLFSLVFLPRRYTLFFIVLILILILIFGALNPSLPMIVVVRGPLIFNMIGTFFIIILTTFWRRREMEKQQYLRENERQEAQLVFKREQYAILSRFVEAISHDLRTRLSLIETNRFFVKRQIELDRIDESAKNRLDNIRDIIDDIDQQLSNLNVVVNLGNPQPLSIDLNHVVADICNEMQQMAQQYEVELNHFPEAPPTPVICSPEHLHTAITHLVRNALTHSKPNSTVTLTVSSTDNYGCCVVEDQGEGIDPDHLQSIFDIFYKTDTARTTTHGGLGLGLTIVKLIAEAYSGQITVESKLDKGSKFTLCLPLNHQNNKS